ncbi:hypothetical protein [Labrys sp. ZIDIC5]|uniref:hypothetical protein n=1 Tax=Labrys sedimenti TaxID=3106036 RepID=UPI002ACA53FF|nr:hypothetical protein [Labrys sp. ZIDIC5]MDZ5453892.1 hypothetical protein [Labrys sp. ZIDIC5]
MSHLLQSILTATGIILSLIVDSHAECDPKNFTFADVETADMSDTIKMMSYTFSEQSRQEASDTSASGSGYFGAPVSLTYGENKSLAQKTLEENKFIYDRTMVKSFARTALSQVGREMYSDCLATQAIRAVVNSAAYRGSEFFLDVQWTPREPRPGAGDFVIRVVNGTVEGQKRLTGTFIPQERKQFLIARDPDREAQISIVIGKMTYPPLEIPPVLKPVKFKFSKLQGKASIPRQGVGDMCTDSAYLVSENGSAAGPDSKSCTLCIQRPENGVLLKSTAAFQGPPESKYVHSEISTSGDLEVCGRFYTIGPGKGSGRAEVPRGSVFSVWAAVPQ